MVLQHWRNFMTSLKQATNVKALRLLQTALSTQVQGRGFLLGLQLKDNGDPVANSRSGRYTTCFHA